MPSPHRRILLLCATVLVVFLVAGHLAASGQSATQSRMLKHQDLGRGANGVAFVRDNTCAACHEEQFKDWRRSHHAHSMAAASSASVRANFDNVTYDENGKSARFFRAEGKYFVEIEGIDGKRRPFEVLYTFGYTPLQQYLVEIPGGRLQALTLAWDVDKKRWFDLHPESKAAPGDALHWTGRLHNWNSRCAECHSTNLRKNYNVEENTFSTLFSAENVGCQSCHGPGGDHIAWAQGKGSKTTTKGLVVKLPSTVSADTTRNFDADTCGRCHSRRYRLTREDHHAERFIEQFAPAALSAGLYHADGQIDAEVFVHGSFVQSRMHAAGVGCGDCHNPHSNKIHTDGNELCTACHNPQPPARFSTLKAKDYNAPAHHFHKRDSAGAQCVNCHMAATTYMQVDPRRDHSFRVPRPDLTVALGTPNACNDCHGDKSPAWAAARLTGRLGSAWRQRATIGPAIAAGRRRDPRAVPALTSLSGDAHSSLVRSTAVALLGSYGARGIQGVVAALGDKDPLVRSTAIEQLGLLDGRQRLRLLSPLLRDGARLVRISSARMLADIPADQLGAAERQAFERAIQEYIEAQEAAGETPEAQANLGQLFADMGRHGDARRAFRRALRNGPDYDQAYVQFATFLSQVGDRRAAERVLRDGIEVAPRAANIYYALGLILAETQRLADAEPMLAKAVELDPGHLDALYNHGVLLMHLKRLPAAERVLKRSHEAAPHLGRSMYALVSLYLQQRRFREAEAGALALATRFPRSRAMLQLLDRVVAARKRNE